MDVNVNEAGAERLARNVNPPGGLRAGELAHRRDAVADDADIRAKRRTAGAVNHAGILEQKIERSGIHLDSCRVPRRLSGIISLTIL